MSDSIYKPDSSAVQFMIVDFLAEVLKYSENPKDMGQYLARQLRELMGVRVVAMLQHGDGALEGPPRIVALEPRKAQGSLLDQGLLQVVKAQGSQTDATLVLRASASPGLAEVMDQLGIGSLSLTPLWVGDARVGTLVALDYLDHEHPRDVVPLLSALSPVFALVLRNALQFESQEAKVLAQAEEYRTLVKANIDGFLTITGTGAILDANEAYLEMTGFSLEELRQFTLSALEAREAAPETARHIERIKKQGSDRFPSTHRRKDGTLFPVEVSTTFVPARGVFLSFIRDLTEKVLADAAIRESEQRFNTAFAFMPMALGIASSDDDAFLAVNQAYANLTGYSELELMGSTSDQLGLWANPGDRAEVHDLIAAGRSVANHEIQLRRKDGTLLWVSYSGRRVTLDGRPCLLSGLMDISDRKRAEEERLRFHADLLQVQKMESLGSLAGGLAHDMNNVLGAIMALASAHLASLPREDPLYSSLETICDAATRGGNTVKRLLAFARQAPSERNELDLNTLLLEQARLLERTTLAKVQLELDLRPDLRPILGDASALTHALMNLCVNAVDAMGDGGTLTFRTRNLGADQIEVTVEDDGSGMSEEVLGRAMDPFFTTKAIGKGTGLGLALVFSTVNAHGGHLTLQSQPGLGTRVVMTFPATAPQAREPGQAAGVRREAKGRALHVLLVDDDELIQVSTGMLVETLGHSVTPALSGEAALGLLAEGLPAEAVILDMNMPGLGGKGTLPRLRERYPDLPVILATGRADQEALDLVASHRNVTLLSKPFSFEELREILEQVAGRGAS